jgi:tetratricopeptide (TPR) repeat protein
MKNIEILLCLLEKKKLTPEEQSQLSNILLEDEESKEYYDFYRKIERIVKSSSHIDAEELGEYILFKNEIGEWKNLRCAAAAIPKIEEHLKTCPDCLNEFKKLNEEYSEVDNFLLSGRIEDSFYRKVFSRVLLKSRYIFSSFAAAAVIYLILVIISDITTPSYYNYAELKDQSEFYITRGRVTDNFQESIKALEEDNYEQAIEFLKKDINENPNDETIFYSYYIIGLSCMKEAEKDYLGLFPSYNKSKANEALLNFQTAIEKNTSGKYPNITLNAFFYSAKVYLMLDNIPFAKEYFQKVILNKGSKMKEAREILRELE